MKVTLAYTYAYEGTEHEPDTTVELPDGVAAQLVADGKARTVETKTATKKKES